MTLDPRAIVAAALTRLQRAGAARAGLDDDDGERIAQLAEQITVALAVALGVALVSAIAVLLGAG